MSAKRFIQYVGCGFLGVLGLTSLLVAKGKMLTEPWEYGIWKNKEKQASRYLSSGVTVIVGDSRALGGLIPKEMGEDYYNFAIGGTTIIEGFHFLQYLVQAQRCPKRLILAYGPFHYAMLDVFWDRTGRFYTDLITKQQVREILASAEKEQTQDIPPFTAYHQRYEYPIGLQVNFAPTYQVCFNFRHHCSVFANNRKAWREDALARGHFSFGNNPGCDGLNQEASQKEFTPSPLITLYLEKCLALAQEHGIQVYIVTPPVNQASWDQMTPEYKQGFKDFLRTYNHQATVVFDDIPVFANDFFHDPSHVNHKGAQRFTQMTQQIIENLTDHESKV